jgi:hypothetical protein
VHNSAQISFHQCLIGALLRVAKVAFIFGADGFLTPFHIVFQIKFQPSVNEGI